MSADEARRELQRRLDERARRDRARLLWRLLGWCLLLAALAVVAWVAVAS